MNTLELEQRGVSIRLNWPFESNQFWSLVDIYNFSASEFGIALRWLDVVSHQLTKWVSEGTLTENSLFGETKDKDNIVQALFGKLRQFCSDLALRMCVLEIDDLTNDLEKKTIRDVQDQTERISRMVIRELSGYKFLYIPQNRSVYLEGSTEAIFGLEVCSGFSDAIDDMEEALKCFGYGRWTAATFHCMGILEIGFKSLCRELQVTIDLDAPDCTWNKMSQAITQQIRPCGHNPAPRKVSHPTTWNEDEVFFNECLADLSIATRAYRNPAMHFRKVRPATEESAKKVLDFTISFMQHLATKVNSVP